MARRERGPGCPRRAPPGGDRADQATVSARSAANAAISARTAADRAHAGSIAAGESSDEAKQAADDAEK
ncbi:hypothetical protein GCM10020295_78270 [Streptomyces cinereospinus]